MSDPGVLRVAGEPPNYAEVKGDRKKLGLYISALKRWSRVGGVPKKDQADTIIYHAPFKKPNRLFIGCSLTMNSLVRI